MNDVCSTSFDGINSPPCFVINSIINMEVTHVLISSPPCKNAGARGTTDAKGTYDENSMCFATLSFPAAAEDNAHELQKVAEMAPLSLAAMLLILHHAIGGERAPHLSCGLDPSAKGSFSPGKAEGFSQMAVGEGLRAPNPQRAKGAFLQGSGCE